MVIELSEKAKKSLNEYIEQVKRSLKGVKYIDADEIVQNVNEHIENELGDTTETVSPEKLDAVLEKLGSPLQWVPEEEISWWRKFILRIHSGPEDWRLAYLSFGLFIAGFIFIGLFLVFLFASYLVSRAALSLSNYNLKVKEQKWLIYPSLIAVHTPLLIFLVTWPLILIFTFWVPIYSSSLAEIMGSKDIGLVESVSFIVGIVISAASLGVIWTGCGLLLLGKKRQHLIHSLFKPFGDKFNRKWSMILIFVGISLFALSIVAAFVINYFEIIPVGLLSNKLFF